MSALRVWAHVGIILSVWTCLGVTAVTARGATNLATMGVPVLVSLEIPSRNAQNICIKCERKFFCKVSRSHQLLRVALRETGMTWHQSMELYPIISLEAKNVVLLFCSFTSRPPLLLSLAWILRLSPLRLFTLRADINFLATLAACTFWTASYQFNHIISNKCEYFQLFCIRTDMCCIIYHQFIAGKPFLMSSYFENFHYLSAG